MDNPKAAIFVSYRHTESAWAGRLSDFLKRNIRKTIFRDIDGIRPGEDFELRIIQAITSCRTLLVVIGPAWLRLTSDNGLRRIDDPKDVARIEIATAFKANIPVIAILVGGATIPDAQELPEDIRLLSSRQACELTDQRWEYDCQKLVQILNPLVKDPLLSNPAVMVGIVVLAIMIGAGLEYLLRGRSEVHPKTTTNEPLEPEKDFRAALANYDPQIFFGDKTYSVARLFPDRNSTDVDSGLESVLANAKTTFDMAVINGRHTLESHHQHLEEAIERGVTLRIVLFDSTIDSNRRVFAEATNQKIATLQVDFDAARDILTGMESRLRNKGLPTARLQVKFYPKLLLYTVWIKDRDDKTKPPISRIKIHMVEDKTVWPAFHIARDGKELTRNLSTEFEKIWRLSSDRPRGSVAKDCIDISGVWNDVSPGSVHMLPLSVSEDNCFIDARFEDKAGNRHQLTGKLQGSGAHVLIVRNGTDCRETLKMFGSFRLQDSKLVLDTTGSSGNCGVSTAFTRQQIWEHARTK